MGKNLPPIPDEKINNSTIAGIDANKNNIRDDVELAIFKKYPNSAKIRAAELQYAQEAEAGLTSIFNNDTWVAVTKVKNNGVSCLVDLSFSLYSDIENQIHKSEDWQKEVEDFIFNNEDRKHRRSEANKYEAAYVAGDGICDIDISSLPN